MDENKNEILNEESVETVETEEVVETQETPDVVDNAVADDEPKYSTRSNVIWMLCGAYLVYTGYNLVSGFIQGTKGSGIGFCLVGGFFMIVGAVFAIAGGKRWLDNDKKKRQQAERESDGEAEMGSSALKRAWKASEKAAQEQNEKKMSIADRVNLAGSDEEDDIE